MSAFYKTSVSGHFYKVDGFWEPCVSDLYRFICINKSSINLPSKIFHVSSTCWICWLFAGMNISTRHCKMPDKKLAYAQRKRLHNGTVAWREIKKFFLHWLCFLEKFNRQSIDEVFFYIQTRKLCFSKTILCLYFAATVAVSFFALLGKVPQLETCR